MKAPDFDYLRPASLSEALAMLAEGEGGAQAIAGGQSLMPMMNFRVAAPEALVDLSDVAELRGISRRDDGFRIGAMTRYRDLEDHADLARDVPLIAMALPHIAHEAIRNRGTIGGSLALADPAAEMPAVMLALGARIEIAGADGTRDVPAADFFHGFHETACAEGELIVGVQVPAAAPGERFGFHELVQRHGDYAMAGVALRARGTGPLTGIAASFFGIGDRPIRIGALEAALEGGDGSEQSVESALAALEEVEFEGDLRISAETRRRYAGVVLKRAIREMLP